MWMNWTDSSLHDAQLRGPTRSGFGRRLSSTFRRVEEWAHNPLYLPWVLLITWVYYFWGLRWPPAANAVRSNFPNTRLRKSLHLPSNSNGSLSIPILHQTHTTKYNPNSHVMFTPQLYIHSISLVLSLRSHHVTTGEVTGVRSSAANVRSYFSTIPFVNFKSDATINSVVWPIFQHDRQIGFTRTPIKSPPGLRHTHMVGSRLL